MSDLSSILVVDDDEAVGRVLSALLAQAGYRATWVASGETALAHLDKHAVDLVVSDVRMPGISGLELLSRLKERDSTCPVVLLTAHGTVQLAIDAMRAGAADFMQKPFDRAEVLFVVQKVLAATRSDREAPPAPAAAKPELDGMVGRSASLQEARALLRQAASSMATVLILGETGTGKELAARALHALSDRARGPFVRVNCGALPDTLFESELFGYEKGAFTGATQRKPGRVELAKGGTLFFDEVGELSAVAQVKLLRLLQEKEFERLGGTETLKADARVVAATHRSLPQLVKDGRFREDLYYRLNVVPVTLPPLRERPDDVGPLIAHFVDKAATTNGRGTVSLTPGAKSLLEAQRWPGNVRQLENFIERLVVLAPQGAPLDEALVQRELARSEPLTTPEAPTETTLPSRRADAEREAIEEALTKSKGNRTLAARLLGVSRRTLYNKLEALGLS